MIGVDTTAVRLMKYKDTLKKLKSLGLVKVFSDNLADSIGVSPSLVRKDFSLFGISGYKRGGYNIEELLLKLNQILGRDGIHKVIIVGAGRLGITLANYKGFTDDYLSIVAMFDADSGKLNPGAPIPVLHVDGLRKYIVENGVTIGLLTVPEEAAQRVADMMILGGVRGILNFAPVQIRAPKHCIVSTVNLELELDNLIFLVNSSLKAEHNRAPIGV